MKPDRLNLIRHRKKWRVCATVKKNRLAHHFYIHVFDFATRWKAEQMLRRVRESKSINESYWKRIEDPYLRKLIESIGDCDLVSYVGDIESKTKAESS